MRVTAVTRPGEPGTSVSVASAVGETRAVVLLLHGGQETDYRTATPCGRGALRMLPFAWDVHRRLRRQGVAVWRLHYRYRGWNAPDASPVADARWALEEVCRRHRGVPVVLVGHSMGGRVAVNVADDPAVRALVLLAPWLPDGETVAATHDRRVVILHGNKDSTTPLRESQAWAARAQKTSATVELRCIRGGEHTMLRHARLWHELAANSVSRALVDNGL